MASQGVMLAFDTSNVSNQQAVYCLAKHKCALAVARVKADVSSCVLFKEASQTCAWKVLK